LDTPHEQEPAMRAIIKIIVFVFSLFWSMIKAIVGAHVVVLRNLASRESIERKQVKRD
jgi:hypothetical protein